MNHFIIILFTLIFFLLMLWFLYQRRVQISGDLIQKEELFGLKRFKYNDNVFNAVMNTMPEYERYSFHSDVNLNVKSSDADEVLVVCKLDCGPCASAHEFLEQFLVEHQSARVIIRFYFNSKSFQENDLNVLFLIQKFTFNMPEKIKLKVLHDWFIERDYEKFLVKYQMEVDDEANKIKFAEKLLHDTKWFERNEIEFTPFFFYNGRPLSPLYKYHELNDIYKNKKFFS